MDHTRDNPLKRFTAFWVAFIIVSSFGIGAIILGAFSGDDVDPAYEAVSKERLEVKTSIDNAQKAGADPAKLAAAIASHADALKAGEAASQKKVLPPVEASAE